MDEQVLKGPDATMNHLAREPAALEAARPRRILVIFNPAAGGNRRKALDRVVAAARALGCAVTTFETGAPGDAEAIARDTQADAFDVIAAAGGDGTINEVVNGLRGKTVPLAIVPLGTANVLADEIGLGKSTGAVAHSLARGAIKPIHVGIANGRRFVMMAGVGFDANVVAAVSMRLKNALGPLAYVWRAATTAFTKALPVCAVTIDGARHEAASAVACNGRRYGGPFVAARDASLSDRRFHVVLMRGRGWFSVLRYGLGLLAGRVDAWWDVTIAPGQGVVVDGVAGQPVQADGDIIAHLPVTISIDPEPVLLVYPAVR